MKAWVITYYVATRFNPMSERTRLYGASLSEDEARQKASNFLANLRRKGIPVYPKFDAEQKLVA